MKVLFDAHQIGRGQTGNETYVTELVRELEDATDTDLVLAMEAGAAAPVERSRVSIHRVPRNGFLRLAALARLARETGCDLVHAIYFLPPPLGRPSIVTVHDISYEIHPEFFSRSDVWRNRLLVRDSVRRATAVVTVSETSRRDIIERYHADPARVVAIPNGVSRSFTPEAEAKPWNGDRPLRLLGVGAVQPRKNLVRLAEAASIVAAQTPVQLRLVGPRGHQSRSILERMRERCEVEFLGYLTEEELAAEYRRADVFVYPSLYEGFGLPVLEAMASGVPVVTSTGGSLPEVAADAALIADPLDPSAIAESILRIAGDADLWLALRESGQRRAASFSWSRAARSMAGLYASVVEGSLPGWTP